MNVPRDARYPARPSALPEDRGQDVGAPGARPRRDLGRSRCLRRRGWCWRCGAWLGLLLGMAHGAEYWLAPPGTPAHGSTRTDNSWARPLPWTTADVQSLIRDNPKAPEDPEVVLRLRTTGLTNVYLIERFTQAPGQYTTRRVTLEGENPRDPPVLRYAVPPAGAGLFRGPAWESTLLEFPLTLDRFEARHLVLDANWPAWAATNTCASPAYTQGFALRALILRAHSGRLQHVQILNCGANGIVPLPRYRPVQRECFPLWVDIPRFPYGTRAAPAWIIEDCEVSEFHGVRGGYGSAIVVSTPNPPGLQGPGWFYTNRVAEVRRCQVRGAGHDIAFATARSAALSFHGNVVVGTGIGMNNDTAREGAPLRNVDLTNNLFLDVTLLANLGAPRRGAGVGGDYLFTNINVSANLVRIRGVPWRYEAGSYEWRTTGMDGYHNWLPVSDPSLPVGRLVPGFASGLLVAGADRIRFQDNLFTTRPPSQFYEPDPTNLALAVWRPFHRPALHPITGQPCFHGPTFHISGNRLSAVNLEFHEPTLLPSLPSAALHALADPPVAGFVARSHTGRVKPWYDLDESRTFLGAFEVLIGEPHVSPDEVQVQVRCVFHAMATHRDLAPVPPLLAAAVVEGPNAGTPVRPGLPHDGTQTFSYATSGEPGCDTLVVYEIADAPPTRAALWSRLEIPLGTVVRFERAPDVADDRRRAPGFLRLSRTGPTARPLQVLVQAVTDGRTRPAHPAPAPDHDYDLERPQGTGPEHRVPLAPDVWGRWSLEIPAGQRELTLRVLPTAGPANQDLIEQEAAYFRLLPAGYAVAPPAAGVTRGPGGEAVVALWDGPQYRLHPFSDLLPFDCDRGPLLAEEDDQQAGDPPSLLFGSASLSPPLREVLDALPVPTPEVSQVGGACTLPPVADLGFALNAATAPAGLRVGGYARYAHAVFSRRPGSSFRRGGAWAWPELGPLLPFGDRFPDSVVRGVDNLGGLAGAVAGQAVYQAPEGPWFWLPTPGGPQPGGALGLAPSGQRIAGYTQPLPGEPELAHPVQWTRLEDHWTIREWGAFEPGQPGYAQAVNDRGILAGRTAVTFEGRRAWRAFRSHTPLSPANRADAELQLPPAAAGVRPAENLALDVDAAGHAAGSTDAVVFRLGVSRRETRAVLWWNGQNRPTLLGTLFPENSIGSNPPGRSEALALSTAGPRTTLVGTGYLTPAGRPQAWMMTADSGSTRVLGPMINLNDPHLVWMPEGWTLLSAEDVNEQGWITGIARAEGQLRGYLLEPQAAAREPSAAALQSPDPDLSPGPLMTADDAPDLPAPLAPDAAPLQDSPPPARGSQAPLAAPFPDPRPCAPVPEAILVSWLVDPVGTCQVTLLWSETLDLDGDGTPDFRHERLRAEQRWRALQGRGSAFYDQEDEIEALYPEPHVEVYARAWSQEDAVLQDGRLAPGQVIEPNPAPLPLPHWTWTLPDRVRPTFAAEGLGIVSRTTREHCGIMICWGGEITGWLKPARFAQPREELFGFRLHRADGWHLGWLRLRWTWLPEDDPPWGRLELLDFALHPLPDQPLRAGQSPRPELGARREGSTIVVTWPIPWVGYTLEQSPDLRPGTWSPVPETHGHTARLPAAQAPAYFRLRRD